jgi:hypothetical protein
MHNTQDYRPLLIEQNSKELEYTDLKHSLKCSKKNLVSVSPLSQIRYIVCTFHPRLYLTIPVTHRQRLENMEPIVT